ncbi:MAG: hypothetical protein R6W93_16205, partial [Candidatus Limnocylindrales bacterium]
QLVTERRAWRKRAPAPAGSSSQAAVARFLQALRSVTSWSLGVGVLELRDARDAVVLELLPNTPGA